MTIAKIISTDRIRLDVCAASKKRALEELSDLLADAQPDVTSRTVFDRLFARERLGSTALGFGVALPHGRMPGLERTIGAFVRLESGVDYDAPDGEPVDMLFGLLVPEECTEEHLDLLAQLAGVFDESTLRAKLHETMSPSEVRDIMDVQSSSQAA